MNKVRSPQNPSVGRRQSSAGKGPKPRHSSSPLLAPASEAFTLIELLIVITIIGILAGLTLSTLGYVNKKAARSRAEAEVAALSAAIESYKLDYGSYPTNANTNKSPSLFSELTGQGPVNTNKVYFEPTPQITTNMTAGPFIDPWGTTYNYNPSAPAVNIGFFDLWSTAGESTGGNS
ncbi:MAG: type II secretion system protein GspG, partial [Chthoniobacterales bacterium]|nr:type II secretion system protein GspG [Chthoniobacterales bacterium]